MSAPKVILIVDDEWMLLETISFHIQRAGYEAATATNGEDGLKQALGIKPSLIILDIMLPHLSGWDVCAQLRQSPEIDSSTPILMMSARGQADDRETSLQVGANDFLPKPFGMRDLLARVEGLLQASE